MQLEANGQVSVPGAKSVPLTAVSDLDALLRQHAAGRPQPSHLWVQLLPSLMHIATNRVTSAKVSLLDLHHVNSSP